MEEEYIVSCPQFGRREFRAIEKANAYADALAAKCNEDTEIFVERVVTEVIRSVRGKGVNAN